MVHRGVSRYLQRRNRPTRPRYSSRHASGDLEHIRKSLDQARARDAHERARRFESCPAGAEPAEALRHVEERSEHLAQPRPEYGHCTNAVCIVGRRSLTRGLFLDRRAFLVSYDAGQDADDRSLASLMAAVVPVCAGISLEYYFSFVDNDRYGCGTKLPHNVTGLVGVMDGHASDLRTGLPWQMVSIHEPVRILFVIETTPERLNSVIDRSASLTQMVENRWIRVATIDPVSGRVHVRRDSGFEEFDGPLERLPVALSSAEWYAGKIEHLPMAWIPPAPEAGRMSLSQAALVFVVMAPGAVFGTSGPAVVVRLGSFRARFVPDHRTDLCRLCVYTCRATVDSGGDGRLHNRGRRSETGLPSMSTAFLCCCWPTACPCPSLQ